MVNIDRISSCWVIQSGEPIAIGEMSTFLADSHVPVSTTR